MAFSFNQGSTPGFGATSTPAFNFSGATSTPGFGATGTPAFGAASTPAFGAPSAAPSPFGGGVSTPAFSFQFASSSSLFGASSTPAFGASPSPGFGASSTPSLFGASPASPSLFGAPQQQQQQQQQQQAQLLTKDNRILTHSTKWDDLNPQAQQYLLELEKVIASCREECRQLDGEERLQQAAGARSGLEDHVRALTQSVAALGARVQADREEAEAVREKVMHLLRHTEAALHAYKRTHAWREAARATSGQPMPTHIVEQLGGPVSLPSAFLVETIASMHERLRAHQEAAAELAAALQRDGGRWVYPGSDAGSALSSLQSSVANLHDCVMRTAAQLQALDDRLGKAKAIQMAALQQSGNFSDPFAEAERQDRSQQMENLARGRRHPTNPAILSSPGATATGPQGASPALIAPLTGLFGTASPPPAGGFFGTPGSATTGKRSARTGHR